MSATRSDKPVAKPVAEPGVDEALAIEHGLTSEEYG